jgi:DNA-binding NarL/FixJ family response regulator
MRPRNRRVNLGRVPRCLIVDDHDPFLRAATRLLERQGLTVAGTAHTNDHALHRVHELQPDVLLVDITLGPEGGLDLARHLTQPDTDATVILISTHVLARR